MATLIIEKSDTPNALISAATEGRVRHYLADRKQRVYSDLKGMCERVSDSYRDRVIIELLQNAHDAHDRHATNGQIALTLDPDEGSFGTLMVANFGTGFDDGNFDAICSPTMTTKNVNEAIGNKGVGFLSVFQVCSHPEVYSKLPGSQSATFDGFCFAFADDAAVASFLREIGCANGTADVLANMPRLYLACPIRAPDEATAALGRAGYATVIRLPLKNKESLGSVTRQLDALMEGQPPVNLFLSRIASLDVSIKGERPRSVTLKREHRILAASKRFRLLDVDCGERRYVVAERTIPHDKIIDVIEKDVAGERLPESWRKWEGDAIVSLAVAPAGEPIAGRLYNFLPMGSDAVAPLCGYLDAPFYASIDRLKLQQGVDLNTFLLLHCRELAIEAGLAIRASIAPADAKRAVVDMTFWQGADRVQVRESMTLRNLGLVPTIKAGKSGDWATLTTARLWRGDAFMSSAYAAKVAGFPVVDASVGPERLERVRAFVLGTTLLAPSGVERAEVAEGIADDLYRRKGGIERWDMFYRSLAGLFAQEPALLHGRALLLTEAGDLDQTDGPRQGRGGRRRLRLGAVFLPPLRGADGRTAAPAERLPLAVRRRIAYIDQRLEIAREGGSAARRFLAASRLVRDHDTREILRMLAGAIADPGAAKDPEKLRWDALAAMMGIVTDEDSSPTMVREIGPLVPTRSGWARAGEAFFGRWAGTQGHELQDLFEQAQGVSEELDAHAGRLLIPYRDWKVSPAYDQWIRFLEKAGVADHLRPIPAFTGTPPRSEPWGLPKALSQRVAIGGEQAALWRDSMGNAAALDNQLTAYTATEAFRLPGQADWTGIAPVAGKLYAKQVIRMLEERPKLARMLVYRPSPQHASKKNETYWMSPIGMFISAIAWVPTSQGGYAKLSDAWLPPSDSRSTPPRLTVIDWDIRVLLARTEQALATLKGSGMPEYGSKESAWRFLTIASVLVEQASDHSSVERILGAALENWQLVPLNETPPAGLKLLARRGGAITAVDLSSEGPSVLIADGDDRQTVAAIARIVPETIIFEPPSTRARAIADFLANHFGGRVKRGSTIQAEYVNGDDIVAFEASDPLLEDEAGPSVREALVMAHRYRCSFYHGPIDEVLQRLATLRVRWLDALSVRLGGLSEPVPMFDRRAVLLRGPAGQVLLIHERLKGSADLLFAIAEALGEAVGSRKNIGEPLLALAAALAPIGHSPTAEDYAGVLSLPLAEVLGVLGTTRGSTSTIRRLLVPFVYLYAGKEAAKAFGPDGELATDEDVAAALDAIAERLPIAPAELLARAKEASSIEALALGIDADLAALNAILAELGPPYKAIDRTSAHEMALAAFLTRQSALIRESIRARYRPVWDQHGDLASYRVARATAPLTVPTGFGLTNGALPQATLHGWLTQWLADLGVTPIAEMPSPREAIDAVREANFRLLRSMVATARVAVLTKGGATANARWASEADAERILVETAGSDGWADFGLLDAGAALGWLTASGIWDAALGTSFTLDGLGLTQADVERVQAADRRAREEASLKRQQITHSGGTFTVGRDSYAGLVDAIMARAGQNEGLLETSTRPLRGTQKIVLRTPGSGGGGTSTRQPQRKSNEERELIGFFGEMIAFKWLKEKYGERRVIDESCWKSLYRTHVYGGTGSDSLGYDFEVGTGKHQWFFEVKATASNDVGDRQVVELGSSEIAKAESCRSEGRSHYRILFVTDALRPEQAKIFVLHNPRSRQGLDFYTEQETAGIRLHFPISI